MLTVTKLTVCFVTLLAAGLVPSGVEGDEKRSVQATCPVDGHRFPATEIKATNHWGGRDADGCAHAFKTTPLEFFVWVCPSCKFAGRPVEFQGQIPDEDKKPLKEGLKPLLPIARDARQEAISGHVKYDLLAQVAVIRKSPAETIGRAHLYAAWSCRQQGAVYLHDFDQWETLRDDYSLNQTPLAFDPKLLKNRADFELDVARKLEKDLDGKKYEKGINRILARYLAAYLWRKHGENANAERWLSELEKLKGENSPADDGAVKMRESVAQEREFLVKSRDAYQAAYEGGALDKKVAPEVAYLLGELERRTGDAKAAAGWYQKAIDTTDSEPLKKLATAQQSKLK